MKSLSLSLSLSLSMSSLCFSLTINICLLLSARNQQFLFLSLPNWFHSSFLSLSLILLLLFNLQKLLSFRFSILRSKQFMHNLGYTLFFFIKSETKSFTLPLWFWIVFTNAHFYQNFSLFQHQKSKQFTLLYFNFNFNWMVFHFDRWHFIFSAISFIYAVAVCITFFFHDY